MTPFTKVYVSILIGFLLTVTGCATGTKVTKEKDNEAQSFTPQKEVSDIYIYCLSSFDTPSEYYLLALDRTILKGLPSATAVVVTVEPGPHYIYCTAPGSGTQKFNTEPGKNYFIKVTLTPGKYEVNLTLMTDERKAKKDLKKCKQIMVVQ